MAGFTFNIGELAPMMEAIGTTKRELMDMLEEDERVCIINSDSTGKGRMRELMKKYPDRVIDVGIAEMNMVTISAGLALKGYIPYCQTFGPFLCVRALDQIHNDVAYNDLPVRLIGTHGGISSGYGPTHNTIIEFGIMNALPNMTMIAPSDANQCRKLLRASLDYPKPIYIRLPRGEEPAVYNEAYTYEIGKSIEVKEGNDVTIIATGTGVYNSLQAALKLEQQGIHARVLDMHTIKPIDKDAILRAARETGAIVTVEDHNVQGGMGSIVADVILQAGVMTKFKKIGIPDHFVEFGTPKQLYPYYGLDGDGIAKTVAAFLGMKGK